MLSEFVMILVLVLANGIFAGAEIAVVSLRRSRLQQLVEEGRGGARAVLELRERPERFLATVQIGITLVSAGAAAFGGAALAGRYAPVFVRLGVPESYATDLALALVVVGVSFLSIVLGELVPKSLALRGAERYALLVARPLLGLAWLSRPLVWFLTKSSNLILRPFGDRTTFTEVRHSTEELQQIVEEAASAGSLDERSGEIAARALDFGDLAAADVMVPRNRMATVRGDASLVEIRRALIDAGHSRLPVYEGTRDNVIGYVTMRDLLAAEDRGEQDPRTIFRPAFFVPEAARAVEVFQELQRRHMRIAIVVDEHGGVAGLVTLEDLIEELVGELFSEDDVHEESIRRQTDGSAIVRGDVTIRDVNRELDLELDEEQGTTLAGLLISMAGRIPPKGTQLVADDGTTFEVLEASPRLVRTIRIVPVREEQPAQVDGVA
jgi:putative hemolysin